MFKHLARPQPRTALLPGPAWKAVMDALDAAGHAPMFVKGFNGNPDAIAIHLNGKKHFIEVT